MSEIPDQTCVHGDPNPVTKYGAGCLCPYACPVHNTKGDDKREILNGMSGDFDWERQKAKVPTKRCQECVDLYPGAPCSKHATSPKAIR